MLQQVLLNLGINAAEAMPHGGVLTLCAARIESGEEQVGEVPPQYPGPHVLVEVADTGMGMAPEVAARAFEPFFTTKNRQGQRGTGLGLAIVWQNIQNHGGTIRVESEPGRGTTFRICLPLEATAEEEIRPPELKALSRGCGTVLVVDDEDTIRTIATQMLRRVGYSVLTATNGEEALQVFQEVGRTIDAVLLDISMPVMGGEECMARLLDLFPDIRVILASGHDLSAEAPVLMARGARGVIQKPYRLADLAQRVYDVIIDSGETPSCRTPASARSMGGG
jgi:CheY-like chemotaxis protein